MRSSARALRTVETVVASGNVLFEFDERPTDGLEELFAFMMADRFEIDSFVAVRSRDEVARGDCGQSVCGRWRGKLVHTQFLAAQPSAGAVRPAGRRLHRARRRNGWRLGDRALYIDYVDGAGAIAG